MKILLVSLMFISSFSYSQITKNNWLVGGSANFKHTSAKSLSDETEPYDDRTIATVSPNIGYFFVDKLAGGINFSYTYDNIYHLNYHYLGVGPFVRYYFLNSEKRVNLFLQAHYNYYSGGGKTEDGSDTGKFHNNGYGLKAGPTVFLNSSVALELTLDLNSTRINSTLRENQVMIGLGFQVHLEK